MTPQSNCYHCLACEKRTFYSLEAANSHARSEHGALTGCEAAWFETDALHRERLEREKAEAEAAAVRQAAVEEFECERAHEEMAGVVGVDDFLRLCRGQV